MSIAAILADKGAEVVTIEAAAPLRDAIELLGANRIGALPVMAGGAVAGVLSERDLVYCLRANGAEVLDWPVEKAMTAPAVTVARDTDVLHALALMTKRRIRHLPVVEGETLLGLVSIGDLVKFRIDRIEADAAAMRDYIQSA
ncbi:CBS domain-containing protein [Sphingomonas mesophila]|uniref:CBS domain-containing protein n=1 Tax=Sphingomonas mesophila TaxID=2303576 RepID=UPI000E589DBE|nr:CBS domain-containing protein [Sphingomonas mesophila]